MEKTVADIKYIIQKESKIALLIYYFIVIVVNLCGFDYWQLTSKDGTILKKSIDWFEFDLASKGDIMYGEGWHIDFLNCLIVVFILELILVIPFIIRRIRRYQCKITSLTVTDKEIFGSYNSFLSQVSINIPIMHTDSVSISSTFGDKFRSGKTLTIKSNSGVVRLHFVQNAEEVLNVIMKRIDESKSK